MARRYEAPSSLRRYSKLPVAMLRHAINKVLTPTQREYALLYYLDRLDMIDIARSYNVSIASVSKTLRRARRRLENVLIYLNI